MKSKNYLLLLLILWIISSAMAQTVPSRMTLGNMKLHISSSGQKVIKEEVDKLLSNQKYVNIKVQRALQYFPIIERVFKEVGIPEDIKYLALQESGLLQDAVSTSNAVGFWQFKIPAAQEVGLIIDRKVDQRKQIHLSSKGAAKYLYKNNIVYFDNWILTIEAYQRGPGAVSRSMNSKLRGKKTMKITKRTYWYVIKFLAHKIAFEYAILNHSITFEKLVEYTVKGDHNWKSLSKSTGTPTELLKAYNKWILKTPFSINGYTIVYPKKTSKDDELLKVNTPPKRNYPLANAETKFTKDYEKNRNAQSKVISSQDIALYKTMYQKGSHYPKIKAFANRDIAMINGLKGKSSGKYSNIQSMILFGNLSKKKFLKYNDMKPSDVIKPNTPYYYQRKKKVGPIKDYIVQKNESLWNISQKFGIRLAALRKNNRLHPAESVKPGRILYLTQKMVKGEIPKFIDLDKLDGIGLPKTKPTPALDVKNKTGEESKKEISTQPSNTQTITTSNPIVQAKTSPKLKFHITKAGETGYSISKYYNIPFVELVKANKKINLSNLSIGQQLEIPISESNITKPLTPVIKTSTKRQKNSKVLFHIVSEGETLFGISKKYDVNITDLQRANDKHDYNISIGEKLEIPKK